MAKATFMSMRWLRMHLKEIIWATVILFVLSCFIIGYGTSRAQRAMDEKRRKHEAAMAKTEEDLERVPENIKAKFGLPVVQLSYPTDTASLSRVIDLKSVYKLVVGSEEYKKLAAAPENIKAIFRPQLLDRAIESLLAQFIIELYAKASNISPAMSAQQIVSRDKAQIGQDFDRELKKEGLSEIEYGQKRLQEETLRTVFEKVTQPVAAASATDEFLKKFYEDHKIRFKKSDEFSAKQILVSPAAMTDIASATDEEIKKYYDENRSKFMSSQRYSVRHLLIDPLRADYLSKIEVSEGEMKRYYTENLDKYKEKEQVQARHILIRPKNRFEKKMDHFSVNMRDFKIASETPSAEVASGVAGKNIFSFSISCAEIKNDFSLKTEDIVLTLDNGQTFSPTEDSLKKVENPIKLPQSGLASYVVGNCAIIFPANSSPNSLSIKDGSKLEPFNISDALDETKAFAAAEVEILKIQKRLNEGADFSKLAEESSEDPGSKEKGGDLGKFGKGQMVKQFEEAAFSNGKTGDIRGPIKTQFGWHLIKVEKRFPETTRAFDSVKAEVSEALKHDRALQKADEEINRYRELIAQKSRSFADVAKDYSMAPSKNTGGRLPIFFKGDLNENPADRKAIEEEIAPGGNFYPEVENQVLKFKKDTLSEVIRINDTFHVFYMEDVFEPIQLTLSDSVKSKVKEQVEESKKKQMAKSKATEIAGKISSGTFDTIANEVDSKAGSVEMGPLPYSSEVGFTSYALSSTIGQLSTNGRSYLPQISDVLKEIFKTSQSGDTSWKGKIYGPIETDLGFHFLHITKVEVDQYEPFDEVKSRLKKQLTQVPDEEEVKKEFTKNQDKFDKPATRKLRQIVCMDESSANEVYKKLQDGEIFALLAQQYSKDGTRSNGGFVGVFKKGQLPANLDEEFWRLKKGEFTKPISTNYGFVIATMDGDEEAGKKGEMSTEIAEQIRKKLKFGLKQQFFEEFLGELKKKCVIVKHNDILNEI
ncbi:MAG: peptidylprolyl isomerase [Candidatus Riflebacteria bacterium]|nr:peptidylprolyl isomerase [Candidatus Riflebacteria bacterium]